MEDANHDEVLSVSTQSDDARVVVALAGELDLHEAKRLSTAMSEVLTGPITAIEVDLRKLTFIDSAGIRAVLIARAEAERLGVAFRLWGASTAVVRIMKIAGVEDLMSGGD
ncbi:MAG TPA: STAS domain-containing protein [Acidimicrobiales bacterium]|nr:STAS domain-containing protein [Acidimicrobiales bacterium]